jgi:nicotinic acid mononucleotide adenylyltransferase
MAHNNIKVPYGYEPPKITHKGTMIVFDTFEDWSDAEFNRLIELGEEKKFVRMVLYPQHEETLRRMGVPCAIPYHQRVKMLQQLIEEHEGSTLDIQIDAWEGKRKKYTPMDTSLHFLTDKFHGPYFIAMNIRYVNLFVTFKNFKDWIKKVRLVIMDTFPLPLHPKLQNYAERWELMKMTDS